MLDHLQACSYCPHYGGGYSGCIKYTDVSWVNRVGGCGMFPDRGESPQKAKKRAGQQKQKHQDHGYTSKNEGKAKFRS